MRLSNREDNIDFQPCAQVVDTSNSFLILEEEDMPAEKWIYFSML